MGNLNWEKETQRLTEIINKDILDFINYTTFVKTQVTYDDHVQILNSIRDALINNVAMFYMNIYNNMKGTEMGKDAEEIIMSETTTFQEDILATIEAFAEKQEELKSENVEVVYEINEALQNGANNGREKF